VMDSAHHAFYLIEYLTVPQFRTRIVTQHPSLAKTRPPSGLFPKARASW
jgi:hypothetical protein